jgi:hypothetical protein
VQYEISRGTGMIGTTSATSYEDPATGPATLTYRVTAIDPTGNRAAYPQVTVSVPGAGTTSTGTTSSGSFSTAGVAGGRTTVTTTSGSGRVSVGGRGTFDDDHATSTSSARRRVGSIRRLSTRMRRGRSGWIIVLRFAARNATKMTASVNGRRVRSSASGRLTVRLRFPYRARRRSLRVVASNSVSRASATWTYNT